MARGETVTVGSRPAELTTTTTAAFELGVSRPTLMKMIRNGEIAARTVGTHTRVRAADVDRFRDERRAAHRDTIDALHELAADADA